MLAVVSLVHTVLLGNRCEMDWVCFVVQYYIHVGIIVTATR